MSDPLINWRNKSYHRIITWLATWLPTKDYVAFIAGSIEYGMRAAARDGEEGRESPPDWRTA